MTQSDPERRARPQYGEYASAQEQQAHIRQPDPRFAGVQPADAAPRPVSTPAPAASPAVRPRASVGNRVVTVMLLAYGAVNVLMAVPSFLNFAAAMDTAYRMMGITGSFTDVSSARGWGLAAAVALVAGFLLTAWLSIRALRRGRSAWWIPLVGAVVTYIAVVVCVWVPVTGDPAFLAYLQQHTPQQISR